MTALPARFLGSLLRVGIAMLLLFRRPRPVHPHGVVIAGEMVRIGGRAASGIDWIDGPGTEEVPVIARVSRSIGLPPSLPDVQGLALRWVHEGRPVDLQLASTGVGVPGRHLLVPRMSPSRGTLSSILPFRSRQGPVLLCARTVSARRLPGDPSALRSAVREEPWLLRLYFASPVGKWQAFADIRLGEPQAEDDPTLRFDMDRHPLPGAAPYAWGRALRQPSYRLAQRRIEPDTARTV